MSEEIRSLRARPSCAAAALSTVSVGDVHIASSDDAHSTHRRRSVDGRVSLALEVGCVMARKLWAVG